MKASVDQIKAYIEAHRQEMIEFWTELVNMQAGSKEIEKVNQVSARIKERFEAEGFPCRLIDSKGGPYVIVCEFGMEYPGKPVILGGHIDTVFPDGSYPENPFRIEDGKAYGPGCCDMKAGPVTALYMMKALKEFGFDERPVKAIFVGDEEIGHAGAISAEIMVEESKGGICAFNLETGRDGGRLVVGRKGGVDCHITVHGVGGHAGNDYLKGKNAIIEMANKLIRIQALAKPEDGLTVSTGVIKGGTVSNAIPDYCYAELDIRYSKMDAMDGIMNAIREECEKTYIEGTTTEIEFVGAMPAFEETETNHKLLQFVSDIAVRGGYEPYTGIFVGGMSDASFFAAAGVPALCSCGTVGTGAHTMQEDADVESLFERTVVFTAAVMEIEGFAN